ncbi:hypothetical protein RJ55_01804 [Drechmeria coniospora]|nr:hypothetical protein RJ55_01804 [Drechmeria coniospora]
MVEIQKKVKLGLGSMFGRVEEMFPVGREDGAAFIVRFAHESCVPDALIFGFGYIPERQLSVAISAVYRSKWVNSTWRQNEDLGGKQFQPAPPPDRKTRMNPPFPPLPPPPGIPFVAKGVQTRARSAYQTFPGDQAYISRPVLYGVENALRTSDNSLQAIPLVHTSPEVIKGRGDSLQSRKSGAARDVHVVLPGSPPDLRTCVPRTPTALEDMERAKDTSAQSKPPSEEVLSDVNFVDDSDLSTPRSFSRTGSAIKARVSLPMVSPELLKTVTVMHATQPEPESDQVEERELDVPESPTPKPRRLKTLIAADNFSVATEMEASGQRPGRRTLSTFTDEQVKSRMMDWHRIVIPMDPQIRRKSTEGDRSGGLVNAVSATTVVPGISRGKSTVADDASTMSSGSLGPKLSTPETGSSDSEYEALVGDMNERWTLLPPNDTGDQSSKNQDMGHSSQKATPCLSHAHTGQKMTRLGGEQFPNDFVQTSRKHGHTHIHTAPSVATDNSDQETLGQSCSQDRSFSRDGLENIGHAPECGQGTSKKKKKGAYKKSRPQRTVASTSKSQSEVAHLQMEDSASGSGPEHVSQAGIAEHSRSPNQTSIRVAPTSGFVDAGEGDKRAEKFKGQGPNQRNEYRAKAGGSLKMTRKRRNRPGAIQTCVTETPDHSAGPSFPPQTLCRVSSRESDPSLGLQAQQRSTGQPVKVVLLNPRAEAFKSPKIGVETAGTTGAGLTKKENGDDSISQKVGKEKKDAEDSWDEENGDETTPKQNSPRVVPPELAAGIYWKGKGRDVQRPGPAVQQVPTCKGPQRHAAKATAKATTKHEGRAETGPSPATSAKKSPMLAGVVTEDWPSLPGQEARSCSNTDVSQTGHWGSRPGAFRAEGSARQSGEDGEQEEESKES